MSGIRLNNIMVDLETVSIANSAAILSIGAVAFSSTDTEDCFYCKVDLDSCIAVGLDIDADIIKWWMSQSEEAKKVWDGHKLQLANALSEFTGWVRELTYVEDVKLWGNGASFDNTILSSA